MVYVHLPRFPVQRRVLEEPGLAGQPLALVHEAKGALRVAFASGAAQRDGVRAGMTLTAARALLPVLRDGPYDATAENQALSSLAESFLRFTPALMLSAPDGLWLDASAASLFGREAGLVEKVEAQARTAGYRTRVVLAAELFAAGLDRYDAATAPAWPPEARSARSGRFPSRRWRSPRRSWLRSGRSGCPPSASSPRSGPPRPSRGSAPRTPGTATGPRAGRGAAASGGAARGGGGGAHARGAGRSLEPLLFSLKAALDRLSARLRGRQRAAVRLTLTLVLEPAGPHPVPLALARPTTNPKLLLDLVRHRLESVRLDAPVATLVLTVDESCEDRGQQGVLGDAPAGDAALETVLARLATALGPEALGSPVLADDHRPEAAHAPGPFRPPRREPGMFAEARRSPPPPPPIPDWQLERPLRLLPGEGEPIEVGVGRARSAPLGTGPRQAAPRPGRRGAGAARRPVVDRDALPARLLPGAPRGARTRLGVPECR